MPHKHKRRRKDNDEQYDLPPSKIAKALPTRSDNKDKKGLQPENGKRKKKPHHGDDFGDDTPREFARMMRRFQQSTKNGDTGSLDNASSAHEKNTKKRKRQGEPATEPRKQNKPPQSQNDGVSSKGDGASNIPKILPGERLSEYAVRVDQALPLSGVTRKAGKTGTSKMDAEIRSLREHRQTKHEKRLLRLQSQWREEEARIQEKEEAEREEKEAENEEVEETWRQWETEAGKGKKKKKGGKKKKKKGVSAADEFGDSGGSDSEGDPWAKLNKKKRVVQSSNPFDVVQAPPEKLTKVREIFKVHGVGGAKVDVANVPAAAGSLRRREELASHRQSIVEEYRRIMAEKRAQ
ncbi:predicted protein [Uncinocarpus reesii 1704]|uniref:Uncharacterized protein n=1 Tax=Uncinocarpus reesii (strain UAMH 1704) TaxID=336963 RepID=C4JL56_UNCRE|nr:uncharacterized protein UREG_00391 [Uncinocarpus reesii 1704]EEP75545.1 predicted protein [Uncinocarpus reesii 1704]